jgi:8-oxo-dGTP pyrophosphatase MutT (NUDIX family)
VDGGESFGEAAKREVKEETLIDVDLVGVLKVEHDVMGEMGRMRVIFLGKPADPEQMPKSEPDSESMGAAYLTLDEMRKYEALGQLRGREPLEWAEFIEAGGKASPLSILGPETGTKRPLDEDPLVSVEVDEAAVGSADSSA